MKLKSVMTGALVLAASVFMLAGCGGGGSKSYADGTYEGKSEVYINEEEDTDEGNGYGVVSITIKDNAITDCTYQTYTTDDVLKDADYGKEGGKVANKDYFNKAQKAVAACDKYAAALVESGSIDGVDAITGATINYNEFKQAVDAALKSAETN